MTNQTHVSAEGATGTIAPTSLSPSADVDRQASNSSGIRFAFHTDDRPALTAAFDAIVGSGYTMVSEYPVWRRHGFLVASFVHQTSTSQFVARIIAVGSAIWPDDPFEGDWRDEEAGDGSEHQSALPNIVRLNRAKIPYFLFPAIVPKSFRIQFCNVIDAHLAPARLPIALLENLGLRESSLETRLAEAVLIQNEWSPGLLHDLIQAGYTTSETALQNVAPTLGVEVRSALTAVLSRNAERLKAILLRNGNAHLTRARLAGDYTLLHIASHLPGNSAVVQVLFDQSADLDARTNAGVTAFYSALWADRTLGTLLLELGAEPNTVSLEGDTPLSVAAWFGYTDLAHECLMKGASPFVTDRNQGHALIWAAQSGHIDVVNEILDLFPQDVNVPTGARGLGSNDTYFAQNAADIPDFVRFRRQRVAESNLGKTALMAAAQLGKSDVVEHLLTRGADPKQVGPEGMTALHFATRENPAALETVKTLLRWQADVDKVDEDGATALIYATRLNQPVLMTPILEAGANAEVEDKEGFTALHLAASWGYTEAIKILCKHGAVSSHFSRNGFAPLHQAVSFRESGFDTISALIDGGSSPNLLTEDGRTPLTILLTSRNRDLNDKVEIAKVLFDRGANPWLADTDGRIEVLEAVMQGHDAIGQLAFSARGLKQPDSGNFGAALACAAALGEIGLVESLIRAGASCDKRFYQGLRPLSIAALCGHLSLVEFLLSLGTHVNAGTKYPSALGCAVQNGHLDVVSRLLASGASPNAPTDAVTPLHIAVGRGYLPIVERLIDAGAFPDPRTAKGATPLHFAALGGRSDIAQKLLTAGADIEALDENGASPLHLAVMKSQIAFVIWLLERGALPAPENEDGVHPVHFAAWLGLTDILGHLSSAGANLDATDNNGNTPLHLAAMSGRAQVIAWLLEKKVSPNTKNEQGQRPVDVAADELVLSIFEQQGIEIDITEPVRESERVNFLSWEEVSSISLRRIQRLLYRELKNGQISKALEADGTTNVRWAHLPFYHGAMLLAVPIESRRPPNELFIVVSEQNALAVTLDWTNEPIFRCNEALKWEVAGETALTYLKFFFFFVRGRLGRFQIVERTSELNWLSTENEDAVSSVGNYLHPVAIKKNAPTGMLCFAVTCVFKNALFETDAYLALSQLLHKWPSEKEPKEFSAGQFELRNERLLLEDLPIIPSLPANEFG